MMRSTSIALALVSVSLFAGCSAAPEDTTTSDESEAALSASAQKLVGAFAGNGNAGAITGLVLKQDGTFFFDLENSIRCFRAPCPSNAERVEGTFSAGKKTITLRTPHPSSRAADYLGRFQYTKTDDTFTLEKGATTYKLDVAGSYCQEATDCDGQALIVPACVGQFSCSASSTCDFSCGHPPPLDPCIGLDREECDAKPSICRKVMGPSSCTPGPNPRCTRDFVFKSCAMR